MKGHFLCKIAVLSVLIFSFVNISHAQYPDFKHQVIAPINCSQARQIADFNNDGKGDILVVEGEFEPVQFTWYEYPDWKKHDVNNEALRTLHYVADCSVMDVDNDGDIDIIIPDSHEGPKRVLWFENPLPDRKASAPWTKHIIVELGDVSALKDIEVADFNNDNKLDVAVRGQNEFFISYQNTPVKWETISFSIKPHEGMASGDIDKDGFIDIVLNGYWLKNPGKNINSVWQEYIFDPKWFNQNTGSWQDNNVQVRTADIDGDGLLEIVISNSEKPGYPVSWYKAPKNLENGIWTEQKIGHLDYCHTLQPGDFDNDGDMDVLAAEMKKENSSGRMILFLHKGFSKSPASGIAKKIEWTEHVISNHGAYWSVIGDIGSDGDLDILSSGSYNNPPIEIWENKINNIRP